MGNSYRDAGVDLDAAERAKERLGPGSLEALLGGGDTWTVS